jgi:hypothetical protein
MATVYKAFQPALARYVAIKVLPAFFSEDPEFRERFHREAIAIAQLRHPNVLAVHDLGEEDGVNYMVEEFVDGGTLAEQLGAPLPVDYVVRVLGPIASALDYAHARGVIHRDVKPSNILLAHDGTPILADFGLARLGGSLPHLTRTGTSAGTPEYMAPEYASGEDPSPASDQYSLAVVCFEMLTGELPYTAATPLAVLLAHVSKPLPPPREINPAISPTVETALLKGLAKTADARYATATALITALEDAARPSTHVEPTAVTPLKPLGVAAIATLRTVADTEADFLAWLTSHVSRREQITAGVVAILRTLADTQANFLAWLAPHVPRREGIAAGMIAILLAGGTFLAMRAGGQPPSPPLAIAPLGVAVAPAPALQTVEGQWQATLTEAETVWGTDWPQAITLMESFLADNPGYDEANEKLYAAFISYADELVDLGRPDEAADVLVRAETIAPERGEAAAAVLQLTPTAAPTAVPTLAPVPTVRPAALVTTPTPSGPTPIPATATKAVFRPPGS